MSDKVPIETIKAFSRTIVAEAHKYGFGQIDIVRLINAIMDEAADLERNTFSASSRSVVGAIDQFDATELPLRSSRLKIREADPAGDLTTLQEWMQDTYGRHFLLSCSTAQSTDLESLVRNPANKIGIIEAGGPLIGAVAFLDIDELQRRAELRKVIGVLSARGKGFAGEATRL